MVDAFPWNSPCHWVWLMPNLLLEDNGYRDIWNSVSSWEITKCVGKFCIWQLNKMADQVKEVEEVSFESVAPNRRRVPYTVFVTREWAFLLCAEAWMGIYFFRDSWIYNFPSSGNWFSIFFVIRETCIYFRTICEPTTFAGIIFHVFGNFSVIKVRKLHQTRCKTCPFDALADEKRIDN